MASLEFKTKPDFLCAHLREMAQRLGAGAKLPSVRVLGESLGVSTRTLHVALGRLEADGVICRKHGLGIYVSQAGEGHSSARSKVRSIALVCNFQFVRSAGHSPFWDGLLEMAQSRAASKNEACQLHLTGPTREDEGELLDGLRAELKAGRFSGVLGLGLNRSSVDFLVELGVPLVTFASWSPFLVTFDNNRLVEMGVETLVEAGCSRLGLWKARAFSHASPDPTRGERLASEEETFRASLKHFQIPFRPSLVPLGTDERESRGEQGYRMAKEMFGRPRKTWPDGVVSTDDLLTRGAVSALAELGVVVGRDVQIASHANAGLPTVRGPEKGITRLEVDSGELVQTMFAQLETLMDGQIPAVPKVWIAPRVVGSGG